MNSLYDKKFSNFLQFEDSIPFMFHSPKDYLEISSGIEKLWREVREIFPESSQVKIFYKGKEHLKTLLCNLYMGRLSGRCLAIPRDNNAYTKNGAMGRYHVNQKILLSILDYLTETGYIGFQKGFRFGSHGRVSRYWSLPLLEPMFNNWQPEFIEPFKLSSQLVVLKDAKGEVVKYLHTEYTRKLSAKLTLINRVYSHHTFDVYLDSDKDTHHLTRFFPRLRSIHNQKNFERGGRLYNQSPRSICYQQLSKIQRSNILIDGERTVELDYSSLHIHLLYAKVGLQLEKDGYSFLAPELRPAAKKLMLILLNCDAEHKLRSSLGETKYNLLCKGSFRTAKDNSMLAALEKMNTKEALAIAKEYHKPIKQFFCSGISLELQNLDAKIATAIVAGFATRGIPVLPVHDSFIIAKSCQEELREAMQTAYRDHTGFDCPVC